MKTTLHLLAALILSSFQANLFATDIGGTLVSNTTLTSADSPYFLTETLIVPDGVTLTIEPGVEIEINNHTWDIIIDGTLIAEGTSADHIYIHSTGPNGGGSLALNTSGNSHSISYCDFDFLGFISLSLYDAAIFLDDTDLTMDHCTFSNCGPGGVQHMVAHASALSNIGANNTIERVLLMESTLTGTCTWPMIDPTGFSYRMAGDLNLAFDETLTIEPGVTVDLFHHLTDLIINGSLMANGTDSEPITLTSEGPNEGGSLSLLTNSDASIFYVDFSNLGVISLSEYDAGLYLEEMNLTMDNCTFSNCGALGLRHITADASSISNIGANNSLERLRFLDNSLDGSCTWPNIDPSGSVFEMAGNQTLDAAHELTIEAGVEIDILSHIHNLFIYGDLQALGTPISPITLRSSGPNGGGSLALLENSVAQLLHMELEWLGIISLSEYDTGIHIEDSDVSANFLTITNCGAGNVRHITAHQDVLSNFGGDNSLEDIHLRDALADVDSSWPMMDPNGTKYILTDSVGVDVGSSLTMEPGIEVEFQGHLVDLIIEGSLTAIGTPQDSITLYGPGSLGGGSLVFSSSSTGNELMYCSLNKLGDFSLSEFDAGVHTETGNLSIAKSTIRESKWGIHVISGQPDIANNVIKGHSTFGLFNEPTNLLVEACDNYWGDPSGPFHATHNPTGLGDNISDNVEAGECYASPLEIQCPAPISLNVGDPYGPAVIGAMDVCIRDCSASQANFQDDIEAPQCSVDMTRMWLVTDVCGNSRTCSQTISWVDNVTPTILCPEAQLIACDGEPPLPNLDEVIAMDNCVAGAIKSFEGLTILDFGCLFEYQHEYKAVDAEGNSATCIASYITEQDIDAPVFFTVPGDLMIECGDVAVYEEPDAGDECSAVTLEFSEVQDGDCPAIITRTWVASDFCGNTAIATQIITVEIACPSDIDGSGEVDIMDFLQLNSAYGNLCTGCPEDINEDGEVDILDFIQFNSDYGMICGETFNEVNPDAKPNTAKLIADLDLVEVDTHDLDPEITKYLSDHEQMHLSLYPIPNNGEQITLRFLDPSSQLENSTYELYDLTGKMLQTGVLISPVRGTDEVIDFESKLESGIYLIVLKNENVQMSEEFVVE